MKFFQPVQMMMNMNAVIIAISIPGFGASVGGMSEFSAWLGPSEETKAIGFSIFVFTCLVVGISIFVVIRKTMRWWQK